MYEPAAAYVYPPIVVLGEHVVPTRQIRDDLLARTPKHPELKKIRMALTGLDPDGDGTRCHFQSWEHVTSENRTAQERADTTFDDLLPRAEQAARIAMQNAGLTPDQIGCVIVSSTTGDKIPSLDFHLQDRLGLRADIRRTAMSQAACAGGALALIKARDYLTAHPDEDGNVLVVVGEELSSTHQHSKTAVEDQIYKALWGDCVAAAIVSRTPPQTAGLRLERTREFTIPNSIDRYGKVTDHLGIHFASTKKSLSSVSDLAPDLRTFLGTGNRDFAVVHPGGLGILDRLGKELGLDEERLKHARDVLTDEGNLGGATVFSVLHRTLQEQSLADGARGFVFGLGPGVTYAALTVTAHKPDQHDHEVQAA